MSSRSGSLSAESVANLALSSTLTCREIRFGTFRYHYYISRGPTSSQDLRTRLVDLDADRFLIIADQGLPAPVISEIKASFGAVAPASIIPIVANEEAKRLSTIEALADRAILDGVTRRSCVVALGGGIAGNIAGLLAGLLYRGIRLVHVPSTLLGMSDSVLSAKQAVNSVYGKNHLGMFHPPVLVWNQLELLDSLPVEEIQAALCELIKNVLCICPDRYDEVAAKLRRDGRYSPETITEFIDLCVEAKLTVMHDDAQEKCDGLILEYGHTVGHAVELLSGGKIRHGFAIGLGMLAAARISNLLGYLDAHDEKAHRVLLERNGVPRTLLSSWNVEEILRTVRLDNKRGYVRPRPGMCDFILLEALGRPRVAEGCLISQVDEEIVRAGIESLTSGDSVEAVA